MKKKMYVVMVLTLTVGWGIYAAKNRVTTQEKPAVDKVQLAKQIGTKEVADLVTQTISLNQQAAKEIDLRISSIQGTVDTLSQKIALLKTDKTQIDKQVETLNKVLDVIDQVDPQVGKIQKVMAKKNFKLKREEENVSTRSEDIVSRINQKVAKSAAFFTNIGNKKVFSIAAKHLLIITEDAAKVRFKESAALLPEVARIKNTHGVKAINVEVREGTPTKDVIALTGYIEKQYGIKPEVTSVSAMATEPLMMRIITGRR